MTHMYILLPFLAPPATFLSLSLQLQQFQSSRILAASQPSSARITLLKLTLLSQRIGMSGPPSAPRVDDADPQVEYPSMASLIEGLEHPTANESSGEDRTLEEIQQISQDPVRERAWTRFMRTVVAEARRELPSMGNLLSDEQINDVGIRASDQTLDVLRSNWAYGQFLQNVVEEPAPTFTAVNYLRLAVQALQLRVSGALQSKDRERARTRNLSEEVKKLKEVNESLAAESAGLRQEILVLEAACDAGKVVPAARTEPRVGTSQVPTSPDDPLPGIEHARGTSRLTPASASVEGGGPNPMLLARTRALNKPAAFDGDRTKWTTFESRMKTYLRMTLPMYETEEDRVEVVLSFLEGLPFDLLRLRVERNAPDRITTATQAMDYLRETFYPHDELIKARSSIASMVMKEGDRFEEFYAQFRKAAAQLGYPEPIQLDMLQDKLASRIRRQLAGNWSFQSLAEAADKARAIDHDQRTLFENKAEARNATTKVNKNPEGRGATPAAKPAPAARTPNPAGPSPRVELSAGERERLRSEGACFHCQEKGHLVALLPEPREQEGSCGYNYDYGGEGGSREGRGAVGIVRGVIGLGKSLASVKRRRPRRRKKDPTTEVDSKWGIPLGEQLQFNCIVSSESGKSREMVLVDPGATAEVTIDPSLVKELGLFRTTLPRRMNVRLADGTKSPYRISEGAELTLQMGVRRRK